MKSKILIIVIISFFFIHCKSTSSEEKEESSYSIIDTQSTVVDGYADGEYCAEIEYYNPDTGTNSTYTLLVEIENNELTIIHWPNGGWLDSTHFTPPDISEGRATFKSDKGTQYDITIIGAASNCH